jgi:N-acetylglucosaminyldiphosphoundecaprenol N-acetyl-beta-D-mannosaminyltransferase
MAADLSIGEVPEIYLQGVRIHQITEVECVRHIIQEKKQGRGGWLHTVNLDIIRRLSTEADFAELCSTTDLVVADGMPLVWASRLARTPLPERVAGSDLISSISAAAGGDSLSVYLLGGNTGTAEQAGQILVERCPGLRLAGAYCPQMGFENDEATMRDIASRLKKSRPDIVYIALGVPKQERIIAQMRDLVPDAWWVGVGISFSFLTGDVNRAPRWMQKVGLEWLHRLLMEPKRLARRYLLEDFPFVFRLLTHALARGLFKK